MSDILDPVLAAMVSRCNSGGQFTPPKSWTPPQPKPREVQPCEMRHVMQLLERLDDSERRAVLEQL